MDLRRGPHGIVRVGHRGAAALAPENSLAAIEAAAAHEVDAVELDVLRAADGALALAHGPEVAPGSPSLDEGLALAAGLLRTRRTGTASRAAHSCALRYGRALRCCARSSHAGSRPGSVPRARAPRR
jgi:glycerophosphoryl diester phosphodiesterase